MDDADLAGPLLFIICFGIFLLFVSDLVMLHSQHSLTEIRITVWKAAIRIYIWCWPSWLALNIHPPESYVREGH